MRITVNWFGDKSHFTLVFRTHIEARMKGDMKATFKQEDNDQSGFIDRDELREVLQKLCGNVTDDEVDACCAELDLNGDGKIDYNEFSGWYMRSEMKIKKDVSALFKRFDHNGDGSIEADELRALVKACSGEAVPPMTSAEVESAMELLDANGEGKISEEDFVSWYMATIGGACTYFGSKSGIKLFSSGDVKNNGKLTCKGGIIHITADSFINDGVLDCGPNGRIHIISVDYRNNGKITPEPVVVKVPENSKKKTQEVFANLSKAEMLQIEKNLKMNEKQSNSIHKLLMLGTGSSGKSTILKCLKMRTNGKYTEEEQTKFIIKIRQNCVAGILTLLKKSQELYDADPVANESCLVAMDDSIVEAIQLVVNYGSESFSDDVDDQEVEELGEAIHLLWALDAVQETFKRLGHKYSFPDNMHYFFGQVTRIMDRNYRPTEEDELLRRVRNKGMIEYRFDIMDNTFVLYDVGGQRNERNKWIHHFADVAAVIFCAALNHYCEVLFEDEKRNAMHEDIELFSEICNSKCFRKSAMILFLTKDDLFKEKLRAGISLSECFSPEKGWEKTPWSEEDDYQHFDQCHDAAIRFIQNAFMEANNGHQIYCHVVCETDSENVLKVFHDVQYIALYSNGRRN